MAELPDAKKWFTGFIDVTRWIKDGGTLIRLVLIAFILFLLVIGIKQIKSLFIKKPTPVVETVTGGTVKIDTGEKKNKFGLFNLW
jgi:hypothetical protein